MKCPKREYVPHLNGTKFSNRRGTGQWAERKTNVLEFPWRAPDTALSTA
eukprot:CAMPEP_0198533642 /NCGR_PEP_ID=MMETSP1462-20131121/34309_1 /TAXON_ID=1333877 /ORGANISM="Brandtodinium nutriculum, Strain RCC3387" /LENGTH=48 /DNA_ID= /DNA_START= /DNA_END= /DNA_ORIENTATION=